MDAAKELLSPRETQVLVLLLNGLLLKDIALRLGISIHTANIHRGGIYRKCRVHGLSELRDMFSASSVVSEQTLCPQPTE
jgi:DNA-binding CsgD family transcriptional regulator